MDSAMGTELHECRREASCRYHSDVRRKRPYSEQDEVQSMNDSVNGRIGKWTMATEVKSKGRGPDQSWAPTLQRSKWQGAITC